MTAFFEPFAGFDNSWEDAFGIALAVLLVLVYGYYRVEERRHSPKFYSPKLAWFRGIFYFIFCVLASWSLGVFKALTRSPIATAEQVNSTGWWLFTAACLLVVGNSYFNVWPRGTLTHGRKLHLAPVLLFGALWGLAEGQLFLTFWALAEKFGLAVLWTAVITFFLISTFTGAWHTVYWDIHVAPKHNILAWNGNKVLLGHIPNLVISLTYFAIYGNVLIFVLLQTLGLMASTYFMRFPAFTDPDLDQSPA